MEGVQTVLFRWLSKVVNKDDIKLEDLQDPKIFYGLVSKLHKDYQIQFVSANQKILPWQANYMNFKNIYQAIENFYKKVLVSSLPVGLPSVNLLAISKGEDKQGLITLLIIIFIACISEQKYIEQILKLEEIEQTELMNLIKQKKLNLLQGGEESTQIETQQIERSKIDEYLFRIQSLAAQNQSLTTELMSEGEQKHKLREQIKKQEQEIKKIKRELDQKILYINQKEQQEQQQQSTKRVMSDSNEEVIHLLRKQLLQQEQEHLQQKKQTQDKIELLLQQLNVAQDKIAELENDDLIGMTSNRKIHHQDCVSINQHKNVTQKLQLKLKNLQQKQTQLEREVLRSKYEYDELSRKFKKQEGQKQNLKIQFEKVAKNTSLISQKDAQKIKLSILEAIKQKLKSKLVVVNEQQRSI